MAQSTVKIEGKSVEANGIRLCYREAGTGTAVVLLHGLGGSSRYWQWPLMTFGQRYRTVALDARGAGDSARAPGPYSIPLFAEDLRGFLDALAIERAAIVGLSTGGMVAQEFGLRFPERVTALVLTDTAIEVSGAARPPTEDRARLAETRGMAGVVDLVLKGVFTPAFLAAGGPNLGLFREVLLANDPRCYAATARALAAYSSRDRVSSLGLPTLVVVGEHDRFFPVETAQQELVAAIPGARLAVIPNAAHIVHLENPEGFVTAVLDFLDTTLKSG